MPKDIFEYQSIVDRIICPVCNYKVNYRDSYFECSNVECGKTYPVINHIPILINEEDSLFTIEQFMSVNNGTDSKNVQNRIVIENCERQYNYADMLELSKLINRPVVFDTHHHDCYVKMVSQLPDPSSFILDIMKTWTKHGLIPKFHISEQAPDKRVGAHSNFVENIPDYLLEVIKKGHKIDIMIEAKRKEQAVLHLYGKYYDFNFEKNSWEKVMV